MIKRLAEGWLNRIWYQAKLPALLLWPLSLIFCLAVRLRIWLYEQNLLKSEKLAVPVIVVGNLTVGGTGKTPLVLWLATFLRKAGYRPGIICSGYNGQATAQPLNVVPSTDPQQAGDEAVLLAQRSSCPVVACRDRLAAAGKLLQQHSCDVLLSDDGLQHYRLQRDIEILLIDASRGLGNGYCLPAGPLREPAKRLQTADLVVSKGRSPLADWHMQTRCSSAYPLNQPGKLIALDAFLPGKIRAVAGLANAESFFKCLRAAGLEVVEAGFSDHHAYLPAELDFGDNLPVLMTEKDAVKCRLLRLENCWAVALEIQLNDAFGKTLLRLLTNHASLRKTDIG